MRWFVFHSESPDRTRALAAAIAGALRSAGIVGRSIALDGPMGAGKTLFVRAFAEAMGVDPGTISSPTYVIVNEYAGSAGARLAHVDASRLGSPDELESAGLDAIPAGAIVLIEWAGRVPGALPTGALRLELAHAGESERTIRVGVPADLGAPLIPELERLGLQPARDPADRTMPERTIPERHPTTCPVTGAPVPADSPTWPFADERARLVDLHRWLSGEYTLERALEADDLDEHE